MTTIREKRIDQMIVPRINQVVVLALLVACSLCGCVAEKESLLEHDHDEPEHWPSDMANAADLIESRMAELQSDVAIDEERKRVLKSELEDLVSWAPEVSADTNLREPDWIPIYEISEAIRRHMLAGDVAPESFASDFEKLIELLRSAHDSIAGGQSASLL